MKKDHYQIGMFFEDEKGDCQEYGISQKIEGTEQGARTRVTTEAKRYGLTPTSSWQKSTESTRSTRVFQTDNPQGLKITGYVHCVQ